MREIGAAPKVRLTVLHQHSDFPGLTTAALPACCSVSLAAILAIPAPSAIPALSLLSLLSLLLSSRDGAPPSQRPT